MSNRLFPAVALLLTVGCESLPSDEVETTSIWADFAATSDGSATHTVATLRVGGATSNTFVDLTDGDVLSVTAGGETKEMTESYIGDLFVYDADFDLADEDETFVFSLERELEGSAPESTASLPAPFEISAPAAELTFSRSSDDLTVSWDPSGVQDQVFVRVEGDCVWNEEVSVAGDPGSIVIEAGSIASLDADNPAACEGQVVVERVRTGELDPAFTTGGTVRGLQQRVVSVRIDP